MSELVPRQGTAADRYAPTATAAAAVGRSPRMFRQWARRRGLSPACAVWVGRARHQLWDLETVVAADRRDERARGG